MKEGPEEVCPERRPTRTKEGQWFVRSHLKETRERKMLFHMEDSIPEVHGEPFSQAGPTGVVKGAGSCNMLLSPTLLRYWVLG